MAKKKPKSRKKTRAKSRRNTPLRTSLLKALGGLAILALLVVAAGFLIHYISAPHPPSKPAKSTKVPAAPQPPVPEKPTIDKYPTAAQRPSFEIYPENDIPPEEKEAPPKIPIEIELPRVAIIIDDLGYDRSIVKKFLELEGVFTFSILPYSPFQKEIARLARNKGLENMLHLPMEPIEYPDVDPGPGKLLTSMTPDQLIRQLEKDLGEVPFIKGVNNHMGSKMTANSSQLYQIFTILKKRHLFFIDSRTTVDTVCKPSARLLQIPFTQRDVFLDHKTDPDFIRQQINRLIQIAQRNGEAVGIAHPHSNTYKILREMLPELNNKVQLVPASSLVYLPG